MSEKPEDTEAARDARQVGAIKLALAPGGIVTLGALVVTLPSKLAGSWAEAAELGALLLVGAPFLALVSLFTSVIGATLFYSDDEERPPGSRFFLAIGFFAINCIVPFMAFQVFAR